MPNFIVFIVTLLCTFLCMEGVTWIVHRYVMHGFLWYLHRDHHQPTGKLLEKNDWFFVIFAIPSIALFYFGTTLPNFFLLGLGGGIFCYGVAYFLIHDVVIHQRFKWFTRSSSVYIRTIRWAHKMHHKHIHIEPGESFGMLYVAKKYWDKVRRDDAIQSKG